MNNTMTKIYKTKNSNKILTEFNRLTPAEKEDALRNKRVLDRLDDINDFNLFFYILIDLSYEFRTEFLEDFEAFDECEEVLLSFLKLKNYRDFDIKELKKVVRIRDKGPLILVLRKLSTEQLQDIIKLNICQYMNDYAFIEYSNRTKELKLDSELINKLNNSVFYKVINRRKDKGQITDIDIDTFIKFDPEKQNALLVKKCFAPVEKELIEANLRRNSSSTKEELIERFESNLVNFNYARLITLQTIIASIDDEETNMNLMRLFFKRILRINVEIEPKYLKSMIFHFSKLGENTSELLELSKKGAFAIINYLNTGIINEDIDSIFEDIITIDQYQKISLKKLNKIIKAIDKKDGTKNNTILAYKLYLIFGYEISIELLNDKFGDISYARLFNFLDKCKVKNVQINDSYEPCIKEDFIRFLIGDKKDNNTTIKRIIRGEIELLDSRLYYVYNNFERIQDTIGKKVHLNKLLPLLQSDGITLAPDEYKFNESIISDILKSKGYADLFGNRASEYDFFTKQEIIHEACNFYHDHLEKRIVSSIPRIVGNTEDDYSYEVIRLDDPIIVTLGYKTGCCFRIHGCADKFLRYCSESIYGRVIVIKNEYNEICAMVPIIRNGNVIVGNSIESKSNKGNPYKVYNALKEAYDDIMEVSEANEKDPIIACLVSNLHGNCYSKKKIERNVYPIRDDKFYENYDSKTYIVTSKEDVTEDDFKLYAPDAMYYDERPKILVSTYESRNHNNRTEIDNRIKAIDYKLNKKHNRYYYYSSYVACSEDWYLIVNYHDIFGECLDKDPRAKEEFERVKEYFENRMSYYSINSVELDKSMNEVTSKTMVLKNKNLNL